MKQQLFLFQRILGRTYCKLFLLFSHSLLLLFIFLELQHCSKGQSSVSVRAQE